MRFIVKREELVEVLQKVAGVVGKKQADPVLAHCHFKVLTHQLIVVGTDLELELKATVTLAQEAEPGEATLPARKMLDICRALPEGSDVDVVVIKNKASVKSGQSVFSLSCMDADLFPSIKIEGEDNINLDIDPVELLGMLNQTFFSMAAHDVRYYLNGVLLHVKDGSLCAVGTDGHRLSYCVGPKIKNDAKISFILPRKAVLELMRLLPTVDEGMKLVLASNHISLTCKEFVFVSKLVEGAFPAYETILQNKMVQKVSFASETLKKSLARVAILSNEKNKGIKMQFSSECLKLSSNNPAQEEAQETLPVQYDGEDINLSFNVTYILDVLNHLPASEVTMAFNDANSGIILSSSTAGCKSIHVVMPMRL